MRVGVWILQLAGVYIGGVPGSWGREQLGKKWKGHKLRKSRLERRTWLSPSIGPGDFDIHVSNEASVFTLVHADLPGFRCLNDAVRLRFLYSGDIDGI